MTNQEKMTKAYNDSNAAIHAMLERLTAASEQHFSANPAKADWGNVGDVQGIEEQLKAISDRVFHEGEFAA